jgi:hypothetical protein
MAFTTGFGFPSTVKNPQYASCKWSLPGKYPLMTAGFQGASKASKQETALVSDGADRFRSSAQNAP